ncbi:MAG: DUF1376 domain-containing protein [Acetobacter sp.]
MTDQPPPPLGPASAQLTPSYALPDGASFPDGLSPERCGVPVQGSDPAVQPLTPPDCDLRGLPFMPLDTVRLLDSDLFALSTGAEFKSAVALWCKAWQQVPAASLPDHDRVLAHLSGAGADWPQVRAMALHGWITCADGRLYHPVLADKAAHAWKGRLAQRARAARRWHPAGSGPDTSPDPTTRNGAQGGAAPRGDLQVDIRTDAAAYAPRHARESTRESTRKSTSQRDSHKDSSGLDAAKNASPPVADGTLRSAMPAFPTRDVAAPSGGAGQQAVEGAADRSAPLCNGGSGGGRRAVMAVKGRGTRRPHDWKPDDKDRGFAQGLGLNAAGTAERFVDYWLGVPGAKGCKADWAATWRNWCRRERAGQAHTISVPAGSLRPADAARAAGARARPAHPLEEQARRLAQRLRGEQP